MHIYFLSKSACAARRRLRMSSVVALSIGSFPSASFARQSLGSLSRKSFTAWAFPLKADRCRTEERKEGVTLFTSAPLARRRRMTSAFPFLAAYRSGESPQMEQELIEDSLSLCSSSFTRSMSPLLLASHKELACFTSSRSCAKNEEREAQVQDQP